jgi:23S rRNA (uracil1939-C5)-methyltransferase
VRLHIEKAIYGGAGLARAEGKAVFVPFTLPGEVVEAHIAGENRGYATAELDAVIEPSPVRTQAPCPYFGECGGCYYQHAEYAPQAEMKIAILRETLERGRIAAIPEIVPVTAEPLGYRNRVRLHVRRNPFSLCYKLRNSHVNLPVATCPIAAPALQQAIERLNREGEGIGIADWVREIELFTDANESAMLVALWTDTESTLARRALQDIWPRLRLILPDAVGAAVFSAEKARRADKNVAQIGASSLQYSCGSRQYRVSLGSFFQVNRFLIEPLVELVVGSEDGAAAWDLYAGVGLFSLPLAAHFTSVVAVESAGTSVRDLHENLRGTRHRVVAAETAAFLRRALEQRESPPDLVVVDPPRAGLGSEVTTALGKLRPRKITYVSCDPATLSRDLAALLEFGYRLRTMHLVDLFPQTFHLESVTRLSLD